MPNKVQSPNDKTELFASLRMRLHSVIARLAKPAEAISVGVLDKSGNCKDVERGGFQNGIIERKIRTKQSADEDEVIAG